LLLFREVVGPVGLGVAAGRKALSVEVIELREVWPGPLGALQAQFVNIAVRFRVGL
jgi:hypothetical protein